MAIIKKGKIWLRYSVGGVGGSGNIFLTGKRFRGGSLRGYKHLVEMKGKVFKMAYNPGQYVAENGNIDYEALANEAERIDSEENPEKVIALLEPYRNDSNNHNSLFYYFLGSAYNKLGREKEAIDLYNKSIKLDSSNCLPYFDLYVSSMEKGENEEASVFLHEYLTRAKVFIEKYENDSLHGGV